ncbi:LysR family transcriptional regulator [Paracoccus alkanivorans]|uniref:LysR family transcriptional regulator n=1 Tax=Paracoccus alkanivorans TaxID=2116655 RepID=A0A3M0MCH7_9RHOB|nr:LysR family transcriptional regulator [Paracoccus alkanivorans]RMC35466.1 LysR family transcriptional regulator [Paracoccus alkanivorans]
MKNSLPLGVDFAALRTLRLVFELRSFTAAATSLGVNQSAVSYTIDKLRRIFNDPLFFRLGGKVVPTERCEQLAQQASDMLDVFEAMISSATFEPAEANQTLSIACNHYERLVILPQVIRALRKQAPGLRLGQVNSTNQGPDLLKRGIADVLIGPIRPDEDGFYCRTVLAERYCCIMDPANPLASGKLTKDAYTAANHLTVNYGGDWRSRFLVDLENDGRKLNEVIQIPSPAGLDELLPGTDLISTLPIRLAEPMADRLALRPCPYPGEFEIHMVWTARTHHSPMYGWFRDLVVDTIRRTVKREPEPDCFI